MDKLWAPWRSKYVTKVIKKNNEDLFLKIAKEKKDKKNYVFVRTKYSYAVLNIYPYNNGHVLVVPYRRVNGLSKLKKAERADLMDLVDLTQSLLDEILKPHGYNIGINIGRAAGAGVPEHIHVHIVPRWLGDVNFMPVTGQTKIVSQSLASLHTQLVNAYKKRNRRTRK